MLIAILGVLKSGSAYVPLEPDYPDERITYILEDTQTRIVLTNEIYKARLDQLVNRATISTGEKSSDNISLLVSDNNLSDTVFLIMPEICAHAGIYAPKSTQT